MKLCIPPRFMIPPMIRKNVYVPFFCWIGIYVQKWSEKTECIQDAINLNNYKRTLMKLFGNWVWLFIYKYNFIYISVKVFKYIKYIDHHNAEMILKNRSQIYWRSSVYFWGSFQHCDYQYIWYTWRLLH